MNSLDLLIRGGRVLDPWNGTDRVMDVGVSCGRMVPVQDGMEAEQTVNAQGCIVCPGLIDSHIHLWPLTNMGVLAEATGFPSGVTTLIDAGSSGCGTYECHRPAVQAMQANVKVLLNVCSAGLTAFRTRIEYIEPERFELPRIRELAERYAQEIVGLKIRMGRECSLDMGLEPLKRAVDMAVELGLPLVVHSTDPAVPMRDLIACLQPGHVLTHAYHGHGHTLLQEGGMEALAEARARGIWTDVGDAGRHASFRVMQAALRQGLAPDSISTDLTNHGLFRPTGCYSLPYCMSKWLALGLPLEKVIQCVTSAPARQYNLQEAGRLSAGTCADIAVLRCEKADVAFRDGVGESLRGDTLLRPLMTVRAGRIVYRDIAFL